MKIELIVAAQREEEAVPPSLTLPPPLSAQDPVGRTLLVITTERKLFAMHNYSARDARVALFMHR